MKVCVILFLFASLVKTEFYDDEVEKFKNRMYFVHHLATDSFIDQQILKDCLGASLVVPEKMTFQGSEYLLKLLKGAYLFDLRNENVESQLKSSVFQQALISSNRAAEDEPISLYTGFLMQEELRSDSPDQCKVTPQNIYQQIMTKFPSNCIVPSQGEINFQEEDLKALSGYTKECPQKFNRVARSIIQGFNEISSEGSIDIEPYLDALKFLYLKFAFDIVGENQTAKTFQLRLLLLHELILSRLDSIPENMLKDKLEDAKSYMKQSSKKLFFYLKKYISKDVLENAELEINIMDAIVFNENIDNLHLRYKRNMLEDLLKNTEVKNQRIVV